MVRIVELCSAAHAMEARFICETLAEAGIRAEVVGESVGNGAGIGCFGECVSPRIWVREEDLRQAAEFLQKLYGPIDSQEEVQTEPTPVDADFGVSIETTAPNPNRTVLQVGLWFLDIFGVGSFGLMFAYSAREFVCILLGLSSDTDIVGASYALLVSTVVLVIFAFAWRKRMHWLSKRYSNPELENEKQNE